MVVIDVWNKVCPTKKKNPSIYQADSEAWSILFNLAHQHKIAVVVLHHTRKGFNVDGDWMDEIIRGPLV